MPSGLKIPASTISPMTSMIPEPQMPVTPVFAVSVSNPASVDHFSLPMTRKRASRVFLSIRIRSMAPGAARWPEEISAPSRAGPVGEEAA